MPHHFTKNTVQAEIFCPRCMKETPWRIAEGRRQFCMVCYDKGRDHDEKANPKQEPEVERQGSLFSS